MATLSQVLRIFKLESETEALTTLFGENDSFKQLISLFASDNAEKQAKLILYEQRATVLANKLLKQDPSLVGKIEKLQADITTKDVQISTLDVECRSKDEANTLIRSLYQEKAAEIDNAAAEIIHLSSTLKITREDISIKADMILKLEAEKANTTHTNSSLSVQVVNLTESVAFYKKEWEEKTLELREYRQTQGKLLSESLQKVDDLTHQLNTSSTKHTAVRKKADELEHKYLQSLEKMKLYEEEKAEAQMHFNSEVKSLQQLAELFESKCNNLIDDDKSQKEYIGQLEDRVRALEDHSEKLVKHIDKIEQLLEEKEQIIQKYSEEKQLINSASVNNSPDHGAFKLASEKYSGLNGTDISLTTAFSEYSAVKDQLMKEQLECRRLNEQLNGFYKNLQDYATSLGENRVTDGREPRLETRFIRIKYLCIETHDLSRQIQILLTDIDIAQSGPGSTHRSEDEVSSENPNGDEVIDKKLISFHSIAELQQTNQNLTRSVRTLTHHFEKLQSKVNNDAPLLLRLTDSESLVAELSKQIADQALKSQTYINEREQWKRIADQRQGRPATPADTEDYERESIDYKQLYLTTQELYDNFRREVGTDTSMLKSEVTAAQAQRDELNNRIGKLGAMLDYEGERYKILSTNFEMQSRECGDLRGQISDFHRRLSLREDEKESLTQKMFDLRDAASLARAEASQYRMEAEVAKAAEARFQVDYAASIDARNEAQKLNVITQALYADISRQSKLDKDRFDEVSDRLKMELEVLKKEHKDLRAELQVTIVRKENEAKKYQSRIDAISKDTHETREELIASKGKEEHLTQRCLELSSSLLRAESRLDSSRVDGDIASAPDAPLEEVSRLRADLKVAVEALALERQRIESYKDIARTSEAALTSSNSTYLAFKSEIEISFGQDQKRIEELLLRRGELEESLQKAFADLADAQSKNDTQTLDWQNLKSQLESKVMQMELHESENNAMQDLSLQARIAQEAQTNYEREVVSHSTSISALTLLKEEIGKIRDDSLIADSTLVAARSSWDQIKLKLEHELCECRERLEDSKNQNSLLHTQLETVSAQALRIRERSECMESIEGAESNSMDIQKEIENLNGLVAFLNRDKEILSSQKDLLLSQFERLKSENSQLKRNLDETRAILDEERKAAQDSLKSEEKHAELMEKVTQINILRESNSNLRSTLQSLKAKVGTLEQSQRLKEEELAPLKATVDSHEIIKKALTEDCTRWRARSQQIMAKYERIDPAEHQALIENVENLKAEKKKNDTSIHDLTKEVETLKESKIQGQKIINQLRTKITTLDKEIEVTSTNAAFIEEKDEEIKKLVEKNDNLTTRSNISFKKFQARLEKLNEQLGEGTAKSVADATEIGALREELKAITVMESQIHTLKGNLEVLMQENIQLKMRLQVWDKKNASITTVLDTTTNTALPRKVVVPSIEKATHEPVDVIMSEARSVENVKQLEAPISTSVVPPPVPKSPMKVIVPISAIIPFTAQAPKITSDPKGTPVKIPTVSDMETKRSSPTLKPDTPGSVKRLRVEEEVALASFEYKVVKAVPIASENKKAKLDHPASDAFTKAPAAILGLLGDPNAIKANEAVKLNTPIIATEKKIPILTTTIPTGVIHVADAPKAIGLAATPLIQQQQQQQKEKEEVHYKKVLMNAILVEKLRQLNTTHASDVGQTNVATPARIPADVSKTPVPITRTKAVVPREVAASTVQDGALPLTSLVPAAAVTPISPTISTAPLIAAATAIETIREKFDGAAAASKPKPIPISGVVDKPTPIKSSAAGGVPAGGSSGVVYANNAGTPTAIRGRHGPPGGRGARARGPQGNRGRGRGIPSPQAAP